MIDIGYILMMLACITAIIDLLLLTTRKFSAQLMFHIMIVFLLCAYLRMLIAFLSDDFSLLEVFKYSSSGLPPIFKSANTWIGEESSMMFMCVAFAISYLFLRLYYEKCGTISEQNARFSIMFASITDIFLIFLIIIVLIENPFDVQHPAHPEGFGLNPLLQNVWVLIHPPVIFVGYSLTMLAFSLALARMIVAASAGVASDVPALRHAEDLDMRMQGERGMHRDITARSAWLFLTLGISLGGWWSYGVLGWGGYWAWDPVETASLLPWLALTAYFHLRPRREDLAREFSLFIAFFMVIFASALTRGGMLESVHAFAESPLGYLMLIFGGTMGFLFSYLRMRLRKPIYAFDVDVRSLHSLSRFIAFWSLLLALIVCVAGELMPIFGSMLTGIETSTQPEFFTKWCYPPTIAFIIALAGCNLSGMSVKRFALLTAFVSSLGAALASLNLPLPNALANFGIPFLCFAAIAIASNAARARRISALGTILIHLAVVIILLGVFTSSSAEKDSGNIQVALGDEFSVFDTKIKIGDECRFFMSAGTVYRMHILPEYTVLSMNTSISTSHQYEGTLWMRYYPNYGLFTQPLIISEPSRDIYISMKYTDSIYNALRDAMMFGEASPPSHFIINVKVIPLVSLIWAGVLMMIAGMIIFIVSTLSAAPARTGERK